MLSAPRPVVSGLWPPFLEAVGILKHYCDQLGLKGQLVSGYRSPREQARLYRKGRTANEVWMQVRKRGANGAVTDAPPGFSAHNYGLAVDVEGPDQREIVKLAAEMGFGTVSWDPAHLEWPNWQSLVR